MDKTQRQIMLFMPLVFVFIVIRFPAGVLVYWITTNTWTIAQGYIVKRRIGAPAAPPVAVATAGGGSPPAEHCRCRQVPQVTQRRWARGRSPCGLLASRDKAQAGDGAAGTATTKARETTKASPPPAQRKKKKRSGRRR